MLVVVAVLVVTLRPRAPAHWPTASDPYLGAVAENRGRWTKPKVQWTPIPRQRWLSLPRVPSIVTFVLSHSTSQFATFGFVLGSDFGDKLKAWLWLHLQKIQLSLLLSHVHSAAVGHWNNIPGRYMHLSCHSLMHDDFSSTAVYMQELQGVFFRCPPFPFKVLSTDKLI